MQKCGFLTRQVGKQFSKDMNTLSKAVNAYGSEESVGSIKPIDCFGILSFQVLILERTPQRHWQHLSLWPRPTVMGSEKCREGPELQSAVIS